MRLISAATARAIDVATIEQIGIPGPVLMELAGKAVAERVYRSQPQQVLVVCGKGNNAGDGFVVARWLNHWGVNVRVVSLVDPAQLAGDAAWAYRLWNQAGDTQVGLQKSHLSGVTVLVDAIFGTGLADPPRDVFSRAIGVVNQKTEEFGIEVVSIDIASGVLADTGEVPGDAIHADVTLTMGPEKIGLRVWPGCGFCGTVESVDLGYPQQVVDDCSDNQSTCNLITPRDIKLPPRQRNAHKGSFGTLTVVGGSRDMPGAAALTAHSALRAGCGKVFVLSEQSGCELQQPEVMRKELDSDWDSVTADQLLALVDETGCSAIAVGPGLGISEARAVLCRAIVEKCRTDEIPLVIDADALRLLDTPLPAQSVMTPHPGEAAYLLKQNTADVQARRLVSVRRLQEEFGCTVVLKGAGTLIATRDNTWVSSISEPALAVPGSGDVLAGVIGSFMAAGLTAEQAAVSGVYLHGRAAQKLPSAGNLATEIADAIRDLL